VLFISWQKALGSCSLTASAWANG